MNLDPTADRAALLWYDATPPFDVPNHAVPQCPTLSKRQLRREERRQLHFVTASCTVFAGPAMRDGQRDAAAPTNTSETQEHESNSVMAMRCGPFDLSQQALSQQQARVPLRVCTCDASGAIVPEDAMAQAYCPPSAIAHYRIGSVSEADGVVYVDTENASLSLASGGRLGGGEHDADSGFSVIHLFYGLPIVACAACYAAPLWQGRVRWQRGEKL